MSSMAQAEASRINGAKSCGPVTPEGKERSSRNAMRHGLTAEKLTILGEEEADFEVYRQEFLADLQPADALEGALAERIVLLNWRLRRAAWMEADLIMHDQWEAHNQATENEKRKIRDTWRPPYPDTMGRVLKESLCGPNSAYDTVGRYERRLERGLFQAIRELRQLRKDRDIVGRAAGPKGGARCTPEMAAASAPQAPQAAAEAASQVVAEAAPQVATEAASHAAAEAASPAVADADSQVVSAGASDLQRVHPDAIRYLEEAERSANASLRKVAARVRAKLGLPPAPKD